jgi:hypothetical protein
MSMSTPGGGGPERVPSTVKVDKSTGAGKPPAGKSGSGAKPAGRPGGGKPGARPAGKGGGKGRKPVTPVKVSGGRNWGPIALVGVVVLIAAGIIGYGFYATSKGAKPWGERAAAIKGIVDYRNSSDKTIAARDHKPGSLTYTTNPPVGGAHNARWQNCMGDVYGAPIAKEHAVHSLEHGAVWITYKPDLPADQVAKLTEKVEGQDFMMLSPYTGLDKNVSLQAWGFQLKVDSVDDKRIDEFIKALRVNASQEPGAGCSSGINATGDAPQASAAG